MKQTAVEWLWDILTTSFWDYKTFEEQKEIIEIAKQMEKEQIIEAAKWMPEPFNSIEFLPELAKQYYTQTYKQK